MLETKVIGFSRSGDIYVALAPKQELEPAGVEHQLMELYDKMNICLYAKSLESQLQKLLDSGVMSAKDLEKIQKQAKLKMTGFPSAKLQESVRKLLDFSSRGKIFGRRTGR
ncbi:hypothetical protein KKC63_01175 [Patescibacteria group bacterium]|nr:hypothetical protein [Patescibacteria group bacterium]MBU4023080.1 hypothetical protein [Patescibacteria group bacterium]